MKDHRLELQQQQQQSSNEATVARLCGHKTPQKQSDSKTGAHQRRILHPASNKPECARCGVVLIDTSIDISDTSQEENAQPQV